MLHSVMRLPTIVVCGLMVWCSSAIQAQPNQNIAASDSLRLFDRENLIAWCIVPFDKSKRSPQQRAEMLVELGIKRLAYDYRAEHIPSFEEEIVQLAKHGIDLTAWWFPGTLNDEAKIILALLEKHHIKTQLWVTGAGQPTKNPEEQEQRIAAEVDRLKPIALAADRIGCRVGLYNHGGWFGEPENQIAIIEKLGMTNVGIVYNLHHAHDQIDRLPELLAKMKPHLLAFNLNGMAKNGEKRGLKIVPIGAGEDDSKWMETLIQSGYKGPVGILNHTDEDARSRLQDNLDGLNWLTKKRTGLALPLPNYRSWSQPKDSGDGKSSQATPPIPRAFEKSFVDKLVSESVEHGQAERGVVVFASAKLACLSCHRIGKTGGTVGPDLSNIGKQRNQQELAESILWPNHHVEDRYRVLQILTNEGEVIRGYRVRVGENEVAIQEPATGVTRSIDRSMVESMRDSPSIMPDGLAAAMDRVQQIDLLAFLADLGKHERLRLPIAESVLAHSQTHDAATFDWIRDPIDPLAWPNWQAHVNRDRVYDFYSKQATHFRQVQNAPKLLQQYPGMDAGKYGHWGNQNEKTWEDGRWNDTQLGNVQCGVFHGLNGSVVPRAICITLGDSGRLHACFNPDSLTYDALWKGDFIQFSNVRHGFLDGLRMRGEVLAAPATEEHQGPLRYHGFYRYGNRIVFAYRIGEKEYLDAPWEEDGKFVRQFGPRDTHPLNKWIEGGPRQWPDSIPSAIQLGTQKPYATDTIELPTENPWKSLVYAGDHAFLKDGSVLLCTMQGDVWLGRNVSYDASVTHPQVTWSRFASGLHHALGMVVVDDQIFVQGRDQLTKLCDLNEDGEADYYQCFSKAWETSPAGHDFICGLVRDEQGCFYTASGNQGVVKISSDGTSASVMATGFRNPDGIGRYPDGTITVPCSEGEWTPTSLICAIRPTGQPPFSSQSVPFFGYRGPKNGQPVQPPMIYLPRGIDNSAGAQAYVDSDRFGPLKGQMIHTSFGASACYVLLRDEVDGQLQGAVYSIAGEFRSGIHRGKMNPQDGQLYVSGMTGWGTYSVDRGCLQRVRYTSDELPMPVGFHVHENGVAIRFSKSLNAGYATPSRAHFAQAWNYRYSPAYGSSEYSSKHPGIRGHDSWQIASSHLLDDQRTLFLEIPELQPVNTLHLQVNADGQQTTDLFVTCNRLDRPRTDFVGYQPQSKKIEMHPLQRDLELAIKQIPNPWKSKIKAARAISLEAGKNLSYSTRTLRAKAGEPLSLTLINPDVVPHNWALVQRDALQRVGEEANRLVADPEALIRQYVPQTKDVICYTDVVDPGEQTTIHFRAPEEPGRYPFLCTFPGHWMVMNGELIIER